MNDIHSHLESEEYGLSMDLDGNAENGNETDVDVQLGGMPRAVQKIKSLQAAYENVLTLNAGDMMQGTLYFTSFAGEATAAMLNQVQWDAFELGNHEFDNGDQFLADFLNMFDPSIDVIAANVVPDAGNVLEGMWTPYVIKEVGGQQVGIIGIDIKQKTEVSSSPSDQISFLAELSTAQMYADELTAAGVDKIILLTHVGYTMDLDMAGKLNNVDVIIGGDSHTLMGDFSAVGLTASVDTYPVVTTANDGNPICIAQAWNYSFVVGDVEVNFDENGVVSSCTGHETLIIDEPFIINDTEANATAKAAIMHIIDANDNVEMVSEDAAALAVLQPYTDQLSEIIYEVVGYSYDFLGHNRIPYDGYDGIGALPKGSDIAPIVCAGFMEQDPNADICIQNAGGVRTPVNEGNITIDTAYTLLPFSNTLFEIEMKGSEIKQVLEDALTNIYENNGSTGSFPYAYALRYDINASKAAYERVSNLEVMNKENKSWSTIDDDTMYTVITNSYTGGGKDGYVTFKTVQDERGPGVDTYLDYAMSFVTYVKNMTAQNGGISKLPADEHPIKCFVNDEHPSCYVEPEATLNKLGAYNTGKEGGSEISAFDSATKHLFITNGADNKLDIVSIADVTSPSLVTSIDLSPYGAGVQSVATQNGKVAVAVGSDDKVGKVGKVVIFNTAGTFETQTQVGYLPDMVTFTEDGSKVLVANEGEPDAATGAYVDVKGSIGLITVADTTAADDAAGYAEVDFSAATLTDAADGTPVRLGGTPSNDKALDIEPEYITASGNVAYVTLQENNAVAKVDISGAAPTLTWVKSLGAKSYEPGNADNNTIDIEEEGEIKMKSYPGLFGLYMPDTIASYTVDSETYFVTANEGDGREYCNDDESYCFIDEEKIKSLDLDAAIADAYEDENDLKVVIDMGDTDSDGEYEKLYAYGARSFSIWNSDGDRVFDSKDEISKKIAEIEPALFNVDEDEMDGRSGNKGGEPEALAIATIDGESYAFVGLERQSAIVIYNITDPANAEFVDYVIVHADGDATTGDVSPEGMFFVPADEAPNGKNLLIVSYEVSGSTVIYEIAK